MAMFEDFSKAEVFSDKGQGVERIVGEIDDALGRRTSCSSGAHTATGGTPIAPVALKLHRAELRLYRAGLGYLVKVLRLIVKNGNNRKESTWELAGE